MLHTINYTSHKKTCFEGCFGTEKSLEIWRQKQQLLLSLNDSPEWFGAPHRDHSGASTATGTALFQVWIVAPLKHKKLNAQHCIWFVVAYLILWQSLRSYWFIIIMEAWKRGGATGVLDQSQKCVPSSLHTGATIFKYTGLICAFWTSVLQMGRSCKQIKKKQAQSKKCWKNNVSKSKSLSIPYPTYPLVTQAHPICAIFSKHILILPKHSLLINTNSLISICKTNHIAIFVYVCMYI